MLGTALARELPARRVGALSELRGVPKCHAGSRAPCVPDPCEECRDLGAVSEVDRRLAAPLAAYTGAAKAVFDWNERRGWPRFLVRRTSDGLITDAWDDRYLFLAGMVDEASASLKVSTLYRQHSSPRRLHLAIERSRAAYESAGTLVDPASL